MKSGIHPAYMACKVFCGCGQQPKDEPITVILSTVPEMRVDICSRCHPLYTGQQKIVDAAGRVEKFRRRYGQEGAKK